MLSSVDNKLEGNLDFVGDILAADLIWAEAESTALFGASRAFSPADRTDTVGVVVARLVAQSSTQFLVFVAGQWGARTAAVRALRARNADVSHTGRAIGRANTAADIVEVLVALGVPKGAPLFTSSALVHLASSSAVSIRLIAVGTVVAEARVDWAVLPADGSNTLVASLAVGVAKGSVLLLVSGAGGKRLASSAAISFLPAGVGHVSVVVVVVVVVNRRAVVVLLSVSQGLFRVVREVGHVLFILVIGVVAFMGHRVVVLAVKTAVVERTVVEVL